MSYDNNLTPLDFVIAGSATYVFADGPTYQERRSAGTLDPGSVLPVPTSFSWKLSDVSASDAGRTEDTIMHKRLLKQKRHLEIEWQNVYRSQASAILRAFNTEYFTVRFWDVLENAYKELVFYSGDRESPMYNMGLGIQSSVKFNIIER